MKNSRSCRIDHFNSHKFVCAKLEQRKFGENMLIHFKFQPMFLIQTEKAGEIIGLLKNVTAAAL